MEENEQPDIEDDRPINDHGIDYSLGSYLIKLPDCSYLSINTEFTSRGDATGRFHVFGTYQDRGSFAFWINITDGGSWEAPDCPSWLNVDEIGRMIEAQS